MTSDLNNDQAQTLRSTLAYLEREAARRAKGTHPGMMRLGDDELTAVVALLRREVGVDAEAVAGEAAAR